MKKIIIAIVLIALSAVPVCAGPRLHPERHYQEIFCRKAGGNVEVRLKDGTRVDCLTDTHAWEVDFANKYFEAVMQAAHYSRMTGKAPGIVFIVESLSDLKYISNYFNDLSFLGLGGFTIEFVYPSERLAKLAEILG